MYMYYVDRNGHTRTKVNQVYGLVLQAIDHSQFWDDSCPGSCQVTQMFVPLRTHFRPPKREPSYEEMVKGITFLVLQCDESCLASS